MSEHGPTPEQHGRGAFVISQLYLYAVSVVGLVMLIVGVITILITLRNLVLPGEFDGGPHADGVLHGLVVALTGLALLWPHLRAARRREQTPVTLASWGASLYFHIVAFIALMIVVVGSQISLHPLVEWATSSCDGRGVQEFAYGEVCSFPPATVDGLIFVIVAGPVWWWHLRQGRRLTEPASLS